ncbi:hypothetical protein BV22DRAFT_1078692 [Leucogyrophana mollusca]|uniref:Uncharacterized protein n=1 Tax=Leucogyrophana mollusca TaxID=85980 RepID=A0ACB8BYE0_9AGAM|nr:hypothetical protein BV22DRAFT_1078692 [Leucogyrophana mollusca]
MAGQKRVLEDSSSSRKPKKSKVALDKGEKGQKNEHISQPPSNLTAEEVDFPRGGGTSLTPLEVKAVRAEAIKEADEELFASAEKVKKKKSKGDLKAKAPDTRKKDSIRVEHLNYKRIVPGMKIMGQIASVQPLALVVSLPNQLMGHVPITQVSSQFTQRLEAIDENEDPSDSESEEDDHPGLRSHVPDLFEMFHPGQYVRSVVINVHAPGSTDISGLGRTRDDAAKSSRRVELSLMPEKVNDGVQKADLKGGFTLSAAVKSVEDHGYILDMGISDVSGFLSFKEAGKGNLGETKLQVGRLLDVSVVKVSANGRTCTLSVDPQLLSSSSLSEVTNVSSILPGSLVQSLITSVLPSGLNLQLLGFFVGTVDEFHLASASVEKGYKTGQKVKARVLYDIPATSPPRFALALLDHIVGLEPKALGTAANAGESSIQLAYPIGTVLDAVKVKRVEIERGLIVEIEPGLEGFVHISQATDDHVPTLSPSSGPWRVGTIHRARVTGHHPFDGILQLSLRASILAQKFLQAGDVHVGEVLKGTVKSLTDTALFVSISGDVDGVIWPNHYADIALKQPGKRFKPGGSIKCRVLTVDPGRKRIALTAKKSLVESSLPVLSSFEDARVGAVLHAVVFRVSEKGLLVEFYNNIKAYVPHREASDSAGKLSDAFVAGKVVKVRLISIDTETKRIVASIRQGASNFQATVTDIAGVEIGNAVEGVVVEIHKMNAVLTLLPSQARALMSLKNLANHRNTNPAQLKVSLKVGDKVDQLVVVSRNPEKGLVVVAGSPKTKTVLKKGALSMDSVTIGQIVGGRVTRHGRSGAHIKLTARISGSLHPTDTCDDYEAGVPFPAVDSVLKAAVIDVNESTKHLTLSTRSSRLKPAEAKPVVDREIHSVSDLEVGDTVRGFIKSVAEHGLFVMLGRGVDARVQIRELFDEYVKDWKGRFEANQLVKGRILKVDHENKKVEMTLRSGDLNRETSKSLSLADLHEHQKITGRVKRIEQYGLFIEIEGSKLSGLCHKSELSDNKDADVTVALRTFREGDRVNAIILSIDKEKRQLSLGLKPSYFEDGDLDVDSDSEVESTHEPGVFGVAEEDAQMTDAGDDEDSGPDQSDAEEESNAETDSDDEDEPMEIDVVPPSIPAASSRSTRSEQPQHQPSSLTLEGFQWFGKGNSSDDDINGSSSSGESSQEESGKKKRRRRKQIEQDLTADMHTKVPESNADFERLLLGSPDSSYLWIQYMSFQLQLSEIDKAREIGRRAIQTINFREEQERLNVWIALLNLENVYGTDDTLEAMFKDAARHNDSKTVHIRLAAILDESQKHAKAEEQYKRTCKKFSHSSKVWTLFCEHYLRRGDIEQARKLLPRSLQSLEKRKHLKTISKFAQLEYKLGDAERGKTIYEGIVDSHPKRWDLWSIYMDMEAGQGDIQSLRNLFNRVLAHKMTSHKAKSFFKKWLDLERKLGDEEGATVVKEKAIEWTQKAADAS